MPAKPRDPWAHVAHRYELARALFEPTLPPFRELNRLQQTVVLAAFDDIGAARGVDVCREDIGSEETPSKWAGFTPRCPWQFNLHESDAAILGAFQEWLAEQRAIAGIPSPKRQRGGGCREHKAPSARELEIIARAVPGASLNDSERSQLAKARRRAEEWLPHLHEAARLIGSPEYIQRNG